MIALMVAIRANSYVDICPICFQHQSGTQLWRTPQPCSPAWGYSPQRQYPSMSHPWTRPEILLEGPCPPAIPLSWGIQTPLCPLNQTLPSWSPPMSPALDNYPPQRPIWSHDLVGTVHFPCAFSLTAAASTLVPYLETNTSEMGASKQENML